MGGVSLSGTADLDPSSGTAPDGFLAIGGFGADISAADFHLYPLAIVNTSNAEWEVGMYEWDGAEQVFFRDRGSSLVLSSSNFDGWVTFTAGADKEVMLVSPAVADTLFDVRSTGRVVSMLRPVGVTLNGSTVTEGDVAVASVLDNTGFAQTECAVSTVSTTNATEAIVVRVLLPIGASTAVVDYRVVARIISGSAPFATKVVKGQFVVANDGSTRLLVGTPSQSIVAEDAGLSSATVEVIQAFQETQLRVTGLAATEITWSVETDVLYLEV